MIANAVIGILFVPWLVFMIRRASDVRSWIPPGDTEPPFISTLQLLTVSAIPPLSSVLQSRLGVVAPAGLGRRMWFVPILTVTGWLVARMARLDPRVMRLLLLAYALPIALLSAVSALVAPVL